MKKIYYNGRFHTMVPSASANTKENASEPSSTRSSAAVDVGSPQSSPSSAVDAICCEDGVITAVGRYDDFSEELLQEAELHDLDGAVVFPGFIDTYSAPAIDAFDNAAETDPEFGESEVLYWVGEAVDYLNDKGVCVLCLHGPGDRRRAPFRRIIGTEDSSIIYDVSWQTAFEKELYDGCFDAILENPRTSLLLFNPVYDDSESVQDAILRLTRTAAENIGRLEDMGTIEVGKKANFTVFDKDPYEKDLKAFAHSHADLIINEGNIVYSAYDQAMEELYDLLSNQMF